MDPTTLALGTTVTKWAFRLWLGDTPFGNLSADLTDVVKGRFSDLMAARQASREFERVADLMAERLDPYISTEFRDLDLGERTAAADAVNTALSDTLAASLDPIEFDLDAAALEAAIIAKVPDAPARSQLSEGGTALYSLLLSEACGYIVAATAKLPDFASLAAKELLARTSRLAEMTVEALDRLPRTVPESWGIGSEDDIFASKYLKSVVQKNDRLQIFGVSSTNYRASYSLSVAYLSLTSTVPVSGALDTPGPPSNLAGPEDDLKDEIGPSGGGSNALRVEATLSGNDRLLLGGNAGSGKTTLLQWVSVTASQSGFGEEMEHWNGSIPFLLPLRRFATESLPAPQDFVEVSHPNLAGVMPRGWVHKIMADGRAIVLVDGLDELPDDRRPHAQQWLAELMETFPDSKYVVTSRPLAISAEWGTLPGFKYSELLPMDRADIRAFVSHWHRAAAAMSDSAEDPREIEDVERHMLSAISGYPHIATLSTSPLLCALICAMHRQNASKLPENRMDLYETALQMLVSSRDHERDVNLDAYPDLNYAERRALLADFALWLHETGASDTEETHLYRRVGTKLHQLPRRSEIDSVEVGKFLLARSGVLRVPVEGRVDFIHRTFLEYLAASELVEDEAIDKIVARAHEDQWREVVIMAAGHFTTKSREELLVRLVNRGRTESRYRHRLFLLAVACLETSPVLSPEVQKLLDACLDDIMPPENMGDAMAIASAGSLAVPRLTGKRLRATETAAAIRALSLIGTDDAFEALKYYARDRRVTVTRELIRAWGQFDSERYAKEILAQNPLDGGRIVISDPANIRLMNEFQRLESAFLDIPGKVSNLDGIEGSVFIRAINMSRAGNIRDLTGLDRFPNLRTLWIENSRSLESVLGASACSHLMSAYLSGCRRLSDIAELSEFKALRQVNIDGTAVPSLAPIQSVSIDSLRVGGMHLKTFGAALCATKLILLYSPYLSDVGAISEWTSLRDAHLDLTDLKIREPFGIPSSLRRLVLFGKSWNRVDLTGGSELERLNVSVEVHILNAMPKLREIYATLDSLRAMHTIAPLDSDAFPALRKVSVHGRGVDAVTIPGFRQGVMRGNPAAFIVFEREDGAATS